MSSAKSALTAIPARMDGCGRTNHSYFNFSKKITDDAISIFKDDESDLLRYSNNVELFTKLITVDDGVIPSPNSIIAEQLLLGKFQHLHNQADYNILRHLW